MVLLYTTEPVLYAATLLCEGIKPVTCKGTRPVYNNHQVTNWYLHTHWVGKDQIISGYFSNQLVLNSYVDPIHSNSVETLSRRSKVHVHVQISNSKWLYNFFYRNFSKNFNVKYKLVIANPSEFTAVTIRATIYLQSLSPILNLCRGWIYFIIIGTSHYLLENKRYFV